MFEPRPHALVVGGSLSGLCAGLALVRADWTVTILDRAAGESPGGAGLGLDCRLLGRVTGVDAERIPVVSGNRDSAAWGLVRQFLRADRDTTAWHLLQGWLEDQAARLPAVSVRRGTQVTAVQPGAAARGAVVRTVQGDLYVSATTAMLFFAGALQVALIIIALLALRHSPNPLITSSSKETLS